MKALADLNTDINKTIAVRRIYLVGTEKRRDKVVVLRELQ
jgi:hypothetical protein